MQQTLAAVRVTNVMGGVEESCRPAGHSLSRNSVGIKGQHGIGCFFGVEHALQIQTMDAGDERVIAVMVVAVEPEF